MKRIFLSMAAAAAFVFGCTPAMAEDITFYTGASGGGYHKATISLSQRLEQRGHTVTIENRNGSDDITLQACGASEDANTMWIAQLDALYLREMNTGCVLVDTAVYKTEYAMIFFPPDSDLDSLRDLDASHTILIDSVGSGSDLSLGVMKNIEKEFGGSDEWIESSVTHSALKRATSLASRSKVHAVFMIRTPDSKDIDLLLKAGWEMGYMYDKDINDRKWNNAPLYEASKLAIIRDGRRVARDWTYEVPSYIGTTENVEFDNADLFDDMVEATN